MFSDIFGKQAVEKRYFKECIETCFAFIEAEDGKRLARLLRSLIAELRVIVLRVFNEHVQRSEDIFSSPFEDSMKSKESEG
jgi:hypothetical protein